MHTSHFFKPAPGLRPFVRFYAQRQIRIGGEAIVHPVPARTSSLIEFDFGDPVDVLDYARRAHRKSPVAVVVGPQTFRRVDMELRGVLESFVILFQPDGLHRLFAIPMHELTNRDYEAHSVLGPFISRAREQLGNAGSFEERARMVDDLLMRQTLGCGAFDGISAAAQSIVQSGGRVNLGVLASRAGVGMRQFERRFMQRVGLSPKLYSRIARFEAVLDRKARFAAESWTSAAHEFGYYDQMHMIHDFAEFTGATPTETLTQLETVFVDQVRAMRTGGSAATARPDTRLTF